MRQIFALLLLLAILPFGAPKMAHSEDIVAALSQNRISITANFDGSEITVFGAIKRDEPIPQTEEPLDVIITVSGPERVETVRRKDRRAGIWINVEATPVGYVPTFYSVLTSREMLKDLPNITDTIWSITAQERILAGFKGDEAREALLRIRSDEGLYKVREGAIEVIEDTLFRASVKLPANLTEGDYRTHLYLIRDGAVIDHHHTAIFVRKVGIERWLHALAYQHALLYGLLAVLVAVIFGWAASETFRILRRR